MLDLSTVLKYYKRKEIQEAIVKAAENREVAVSFGGEGYGKRPDTLRYPTDVIEFVKQKATSFHCSEEIWKNPLQIQTGMRKQELDKLRKGWDLVMDIDCPFWTLSKIIAWLIIKSLKDHGIKSVSAKFSGNKGFHIGVPFEAMPESIRNQKTSDLFPEGPRKIAAYLMHYIGKKYTNVEGSDVEFGGKIKIPLSKIKKETGKSHEEITERVCTDCKKKIKKGAKAGNAQFVCSRCESTEEGKKEDAIKKCLKCGSIMEKIESRNALCSCGSNSYAERFDPKSIVEVDTILIASRHLYRMPYSLHEKSGLSSVPVDPEKIIEFEKELAKPEKVKPSNLVFLDKTGAEKGEAGDLMLKAMHFSDVIPENETGNENKERKIEEISFNEPVPKELFPPCIKKILNGIEDGKKRSVFVLLNFLTNLGWDYEKIEELLKEWNRKNPEPLREVVMLGQMRYHKQNKKNVLPPNCSNEGYYKDYGVCSPDNLCAKIKNPVSYSIRKARFLSREGREKSSSK